MKQCKICGEYLQHVSIRHLESHNITREEYDKIDKNDNVFTFRAPKNKKNIADEYIIDTFIKSNVDYVKNKK